MQHWMSQSDVIITSTGFPAILVDRTMALAIMAERKNEPLVFIDISVPRNVDAGIATLDNIFCYDIDDLGSVVEANLNEREKEALAGEKIIDLEVQDFMSRLSTIEIGPMAGQLRSRIQEICRLELDRFLKKVGPQEEWQVRQLELMMERIAGKIAHPLITQIRAAHQDPAHQKAYLETLKRIFGRTE
jgi:glutamyl-tRNA reductase